MENRIGFFPFSACIKFCPGQTWSVQGMGRHHKAVLRSRSTMRNMYMEPKIEYQRSNNSIPETLSIKFYEVGESLASNLASFG